MFDPDVDVEDEGDDEEDEAVEESCACSVFLRFQGYMIDWKGERKKDRMMISLVENEIIEHSKEEEDDCYSFGHAVPFFCCLSKSALFVAGKISQGSLSTISLSLVQD